MDRRQKKTRDAIFYAFTELLSETQYNQISVQKIIDKADVGRTTFYAHFETKDYLLKALCEELFGHIIESTMGHTKEHSHWDCDFCNDSVFLHLLRHLQDNYLNILKLLSSQNNELFLRFFKSNLKNLIISQYSDTDMLKKSYLPEHFLVNHISASFVETIDWWISNKMKETPEELTKYFLAVIEPLLNN